MSKILVTGGAGFIGSHVCERLVMEGYDVVCLDNFSLGSEENVTHLIQHKCFKLVEIDAARDVEKLNKLFHQEQFETVWHLAANSDIQKGSLNRNIDLNDTFLSTFNLLETMNRNRISSLLFASSSAVFGETQEVLTEDYGPLKPISYYGAAKLAAEAYISAYTHRYGMNTWIFRFPNVIGSRVTHGVLFDFINKIKKNKKLDVLGNGSQTKPYLHVSDLLEGMFLAWENARENLNVFNMAGDGLTTVKEIAEIVALEMNLPKEKIFYGTEDRGWPGDVPRFEYDCTRIHQIGWRIHLDSSSAVRRAVREILNEQL